jgi:hypothetical protein
LKGSTGSPTACWLDDDGGGGDDDDDDDQSITPNGYFWVVPLTHEVSDLHTATDLYTERLDSNTELR